MRSAVTLVFCLSTLLLGADASPAGKVRRRCHHGVPHSSSSVLPSSTVSSAVASSSVYSSIAVSSSAVPSSSSEVPSSSSAVLSSSVVSSSAVISSSSLASSSVASSSVAPPVSTPTSVLANGDFEGDSSAWTPQLVSNHFSYDFHSTDARSGSYSASINYNANVLNYQTWFNQPLTVQPNTVYNLDAYIKASRNNPGCTVYFYIGDASGKSVLSIFSSTHTSQITTDWRHVTASWTSGTDTSLTFNVRLTCSSTSYGVARSYYLDDISFQPAA